MNRAAKAAMNPLYDHGITHMEALTVTVVSHFSGCAPGPDANVATTA